MPDFYLSLIGLFAGNTGTVQISFKRFAG